MAEVQPVPFLVPFALGLLISPVAHGLSSSPCLSPYLFPPLSPPCLCLPSCLSPPPLVLQNTDPDMNQRNMILSIALLVLFGATVAFADE